jgi:protein-S-isoprenylcysteine O-methyltransferase Ste14
MRPAVGALVVTGLTPVLLARMRRELLRDGRLSGPTVTAMYGAYALHGLAVAVSAWRRSAPLPPRAAAVGTPLAAAGSGLVVAGMSRFVGPGQVSGTQVGELATGGVYRLSRNPQYTGYVLALAGLGLARRSGAVVALTAGAGAVFAWWVPVEESALRRTFGAPYEHYLAYTPRWLGRPRRGPGR